VPAAKLSLSYENDLLRMLRVAGESCPQDLAGLYRNREKHIRRRQKQTEKTPSFGSRFRNSERKMMLLRQEERFCANKNFNRSKKFVPFL